ncbi:SAC3/GANP family protein, partial [Cooperia oncophora]
LFRYVRVVQKRISPYECGPNGLEPNRLVKEYARSAADQDNPLPHELRPKELLKDTMDYLLKYVLDSPPESDDDLAMWYDFYGVVRVLYAKKLPSSCYRMLLLCARLHILCAYKLCHLGFDRFDQNMNTENLAKCLQSLRHLYEDLGLQGETFDTEAEFRGYDVMLHLHDSNIMRQVLSYRKEVRESQPVRLALQLSGALQNKNYVRFFRLLKKEATFLQCCICHRYFNTVLSNALLTMMTAYGRSAAFLLDTRYLLRILAWDDTGDVIKSLALYGIHPNNLDNEQVFFDRDEFIQDPDAPARPYRWINAKNYAAWSQVVYGPKPFSFSSVAVMADSFDGSGRYNKDPVLLAVFEKYSLQSEVQQLVSEQAAAPFKPASIAAIRQGHHEARSWVSSTVENVVREVSDKECLTICRAANEERQERDRERAHLESERLKEEKVKLIRRILEKLLDEVVAEQMKALIKQELRDGICAHIDTTANLLLEELWRSKLWHTVDKETKAILKKTLKSQLDFSDSGNRWSYCGYDSFGMFGVLGYWRTEGSAKNVDMIGEHFEAFGIVKCSHHLIMQNSTNLVMALSILDSQKVEFSLKLVQFKKARLKRIMRKYFDKWRYYVEMRRTPKTKMGTMLHRPKTIKLAPSSPFRPPYADRAKRKRAYPDSFSILDYSLSDRISLHDTFNTSCDSRFITSMEAQEKHSEYDYHEMFLSDSYFEEWDRPIDVSEISKPFRPPSPRPEEYYAEQNEFRTDGASTCSGDQESKSFILRISKMGLSECRKNLLKARIT